MMDPTFGSFSVWHWLIVLGVVVLVFRGKGPRQPPGPPTGPDAAPSGHAARGAVPARLGRRWWWPFDRAVK